MYNVCWFVYMLSKDIYFPLSIKDVYILYELLGHLIKSCGHGYNIVIQWAQVHLYRQSTSAHCINVMYHSPNRWGESHKTAANHIKARLQTSIETNVVVTFPLQCRSNLDIAFHQSYLVH